MKPEERVAKNRDQKYRTGASLDPNRSIIDGVDPTLAEILSVPSLNCLAGVDV